MKRIDDEELPPEVGANLEADEADLLEQEEVAVTDDVLEAEEDGEREAEPDV
jgi:hypothetical protein